MKTVLLDSVEVTPSKVVCVGRNYVEHIKELNNEMPTSMVIFMKPNSALIHQLTTFPKNTIQYEGEISFLIKNKKIAAVGFGLDLTNRQLQSELKAKSLPWERAKAFDGAAVMSEFVSIQSSDIDSLSMQLWINGALVQEAGVDLMIYKPLTVIEEVNSFSTLADHDIIMSGTPKGVGSYNKDDTFVGKIFIKEQLLISHTWVVQ